MELIQVGNREWKVMDGEEKIGEIHHVNILGTYQYVATLRGEPVPGPFDSTQDALDAIEKQLGSG